MTMEMQRNGLPLKMLGNNKVEKNSIQLLDIRANNFLNKRQLNIQKYLHKLLYNVQRSRMTINTDNSTLYNKILPLSLQALLYRIAQNNAHNFTWKSSLRCHKASV